MIAPLHALALLGSALLLSLLAIPPLRRLAWRLDLVDRPRDGQHKSHLRPTPYGGGLAIWTSTVIVSFLVLFYSCWVLSPLALAGFLRPVLMLLFCATILMLTGLIDDWRSLSPLPRFLVQLATALILLLTCPQFRLPLGWAPVAVPLTILWIVALTNTFNFLDNMDGLSAGIGAIVLLLLTALGLIVHDLVGVALCLILLGAVAGFLFYNFPPATVFMGDAGAFFIGFLTSSLAARLSNQLGQLHPELPARLSPLLLLTVPLYDLLGVSLIRLKNRIPPWIGGKDHISHRLVDLGLSRRAAVLVIHAATLLTGVPALGLAWLAPASAWILLLLFPLALAAVAGLDIAARRRAA
jgi:UDP-GlcNAc:undecaprenyl-phosphate GlcNAc-1-phosphate transferase